MRRERTREKREEMAQWALTRMARGEKSVLGIDTAEVIDRLVEEDPGLAEKENHRTPLQRIRNKVERGERERRARVRAGS